MTATGSFNEAGRLNYCCWLVAASTLLYALRETIGNVKEAITSYK